MRLTWFPLVTDRRPLLAGLVLALLLGAASISFAQEAAQQAAPAEKKAVAFTNDVGMVLIYVKEDKTADFEDLWRGRAAPGPRARRRRAGRGRG